MSEPTLEYPDDPRDREPAPIGDPPPYRLGSANDMLDILGAHVRISNHYWARLWARRAAERRAANSPW